MKVLMRRRVGMIWAIALVIMRQMILVLMGMGVVAMVTMGVMLIRRSWMVMITMVQIMTIIKLMVDGDGGGNDDEK